MICPHCTLSIHFQAANSAVYPIGPRESDGLSVDSGFCPACKRFIVVIRHGTYIDPVDIGDTPSIDHVAMEEIIFPQQAPKPSLPTEVPEEIRDDYDEAALVLPISPKASAAISRRLLQHILRQRWGIEHRSLAREIEEFLALPDVPSYLSEAMDAVRAVGNFAAHPTKDQTTGLVVEVEPGEAEWLLDVIENLCDFSYVRPKLLEERKQQLNDRLQRMGRPTI